MRQSLTPGLLWPHPATLLKGTLLNRCFFWNSISCTELCKASQLVTLLIVRTTRQFLIKQKLKILNNESHNFTVQAQKFSQEKA